MTTLNEGVPAADIAGDDWRPLSTRAHGLFIAGSVITFAVVMVAAATALAFVVLHAHAVALIATAAVAGIVLGAWRGDRRWRYTQWKLDADGFALRRGRLWQSETRVPASRVQHLDLKRGPLERGLRLATLVIHTAGTRHSEVAVSGLDDGDAERLRDRLARQSDDDGDD
jgi:membrane protein YdbS with pleckstrin-like domain